MLLAHRYRRRRGRHWHDPERLDGQAQRDAQLGRSQFFVYVLETDRGHYVGHTWNVRSRMRAHRAGEVPSTAGANPRLLWQSRPLQTREQAARFEASLKSLRDQMHDRYREIVGHPPVPLQRAPRQKRSGCFAMLSLILMIALTVLTIMLLL